MLHIKSFAFNPYQENTYVLYDDEKNCAIVDPGMYGTQEQELFKDFILSNGLKPQWLWNTHCHVDHVLGNHFIYETFGLKPLFNEGELPVLIEVQNYAPQMGIQYDPSPISDTFLPNTGELYVGKERLEILFSPGHSPGHLCFYHPIQKVLIAGDVLFQNSIGRTDLPGGNHQQLLKNIKEVLYKLPDETVVYPGHGPATSIGHEKQNNPFVRG